MNRIILVGNGFDLAHQMKTSYKDFLLDYLNQAFMACEAGYEYRDNLIAVIKTNNRFANYQPFAGTDDISYFRKYLDVQRRPEPYEPFKWYISHPFLHKIFIDCCDYNWVDIENEYYRYLKWIRKDLMKDKNEELKQLNSAFHTLSQLLQKYLINLPAPIFNEKCCCLITDKIKRNEVVTEKLLRDTKPVKNLILNFNYTSTIEGYLNKLRENYEIDINYIHGKLGLDNNPIIFGFGDEHDEEYSSLENESNPAYLAYMKSFWYFKTRNYHELIRFIEADKFQVVIAGHSCGLSDRTMLKMILEHQNCKSVKIYYYQKGDWNNYGMLTQELSRHFSNKSDMRKKIVPLPFCSPLPQV